MIATTNEYPSLNLVFFPYTIAVAKQITGIIMSITNIALPVSDMRRGSA